MNVLDTFALEIDCPQCGGAYRVPLRNIALSQNMMAHQGCPVHDERECPPAFDATLLDKQLLQDLQALWGRLDEQSRRAGARLVIESAPDAAPAPPKN